VFTIDKTSCASGGNTKLNPAIFLVQYAKVDEGKCDSSTIFAERDTFGTAGIEIHTSCSQTIYVGRRISGTAISGTNGLYISGFCPADGTNCAEDYPPEEICPDPERRLTDGASTSKAVFLRGRDEEE